MSQTAVKKIAMLLKATLTGARWITVHPNGKDEKGVPVLIEETKKGSGVFRVVGGAGGKLNYLRLRGVKSEKEYREQAKQKRRVKSFERQRQRIQDKEMGLHESKQEARKEIESKKREGQVEFVKKVAEAMGWKPEELAFPESDYEGLSEKARKQAENRHFREILQRANEAVSEQKRQLLEDHGDSLSDIGEIPFEASDPETLTVDDLDPSRGDAGLGYQTNYKRRAEERGLDEGDLKEEKSTAQERAREEMSEEQREGLEKRVASAQAIRKELQSVRGHDPDLKAKLVEAKKAVELLAAQKKLRALEEQAAKAKKQVDESAEEPGPINLEVSGDGAKLFTDIKADLENDLKTVTTRAFLSKIREVSDNPEKSLARHIGVGAYNSLNAVSLSVAGAGVMGRDVVDVLGVGGAAQVLARRLHSDLTKGEVKQALEALEAFHVDNYMETSKEALADADEWLDMAKSIKIGAAKDGKELQRLQELNARRREAVGKANEVLGTALGEMEANAALIVALKQGAKDEIELPMGDMSIEDAIRRARAIGLERGNYQINSVGQTRFIKVTDAGMDRLAKPVDREDMEAVRDSLDIMSGKYDEDDWLPGGFARRTDLVAKPKMGVAPSLAEPFNPGENIEKSIKDYIGGRAADGDTPAEILRDLMSYDLYSKVGDTDAYFAALDKIAPMKSKDGKPVRAEAHEQRFQDIADSFVSERYGYERDPIHAQTFPVGKESIDPLHRALMKHPEGVAAFKPIGELDHGERRALRKFFQDRIASKDAGSAEARATLDEHLGAEPEKEVQDMFGTGTNPEWVEWDQKRQELESEARDKGLDWSSYVKTMGSVENAYAAIQDVVRSDVVKEFSDHYNTLNPDNPIKVGKTVIRGNLDHLDAVDPEARERRPAEHRDLVDSLRNRSQGRYAEGSVSDKMSAAREQIEAMKQSQMGMFATESLGGGDQKEVSLDPDQRYTLGHSAERQIAGMLRGGSAQNFKPDQPASLYPASMSGKYVNRQRAVKLVDRNKRLFVAQGTGSGKTGIALGAFSHLKTHGKAKRGLFLVPSIVQGEFHGAALNFLEPGKFNWHIQPGASREERIKAYKNPEHDFAVMTHQAFRDDMLHLGAKREGVSESEMADKLGKMSAGERREWMKGLMESEGVNFDFLAVDEGHDLLNRAGKENSRMANVIDSLSDNTPYYVSSSADPVKNDPSEIYDVLRKMDPERYTDRDRFMRRYGVNAEAAKEELRREMSRYIYPGKIEANVKRRREDLVVPLNDQQKQHLAEIKEAAGKMRLARLQKKVDIEAAKRLSPSSFEGKDESEHEEIARKLHGNVGILRDTAIRHVINEVPDGAKMKKAVEIAHERRGKPGVIFAHSLATVRSLHDQLKAAGHRVVVITGADSAAEKDRKKRMFRPGGDREPEADILIASDAGAVGMNAQRGAWLLQMDIPMTAKTHAQRNGRIDRIGQKNPEIELMSLAADHPQERKDRKRLEEKYALRELMTSPLEGLDDTGYASYVKQVRSRTREEEDLPNAA